MNKSRCVTLPRLTQAWQMSVPAPLEISQEYLPAASGLSLLRTSRMQVESVVFTLY